MDNIVTHKKFEINSPLYHFLNPDYVYVPVDKENVLEIGKKVLKDEQISTNFFSPISGTIKEISEGEHINNRALSCYVIENDFKEDVINKKNANKYINSFTKEEFLSLIKKYVPNIFINEKAKTILVNGIDKEYSEKTYSFIINHNSDKLLETIDAIQTILNIENAVVAINNKDSLNVVNMTNNIGTYPNINLKMLPDIYPIGFRNILIKNVLSKSQILNGILYLSVEDVLNIYNVLKRNKPITEKYITIGGNAIEKSVVVYTKIGVRISDLIKNNCNIIKDDYFVIVNGLISGITLDSLNSIVTLDTRSIFLNDLDKESEKECINCGLCALKCPVGLNPKYIKEHKNADRKKCINCGLCSYICPSKINFKECLRKDEK